MDTINNIFGDRVGCERFVSLRVAWARKVFETIIGPTAAAATTDAFASIEFLRASYEERDIVMRWCRRGRIFGRVC